MSKNAAHQPTLRSGLFLRALHELTREQAAEEPRAVKQPLPIDMVRDRVERTMPDLPRRGMADIRLLVGQGHVELIGDPPHSVVITDPGKEAADRL